MLKKSLKQKPTTNKTVNEKCKGPENLEKCGPEVRCVTMCEEQMLDVRFSEDTAQKKNFSMKDLLSKCDQVLWKLQTCLHLMKKSLIENLIFCKVDKIVQAQSDRSCVVEILKM